MKHRHIEIMILSIAVTLGLFLTFRVAYAASIYVDSKKCPTTGSGTALDPFCKIGDALNAVKSFDTIMIRPGTYAEDIIIGKRARILCDRKNPAYIVGSGAGGSVITVRSSEPVVIEGCRIAGDSTQYPVQIFVDATKLLTMKYMTIQTGAEGTGIKILPASREIIFNRGTITGSGARYGIWVTPQPTPGGTKTSRVKISETTITGFEIGMLAQQCDICPIQTNKFIGNNTGYQAEESAFGQTFFNRFEANGTGLHIRGLYASDHNSNTFVSNAVGIRLSSPTNKREEFNQNNIMTSGDQVSFLLELADGTQVTDYTKDHGCYNEWVHNSINGTRLPYYQPVC